MIDRRNALDFVVVRDSREQLPWCLDPLVVRVGALTTGDYSIQGLENLVAIERKSLSDLVTCCGRERKRFERELDRLRAYPHHCVVVEASWSTISAGSWVGSITPGQALSSIASWVAEGVPFVMADDRGGAQDFAVRFLSSIARHTCAKLRAFMPGLAAAREGSQGTAAASPPGCSRSPWRLIRSQPRC